MSMKIPQNFAAPTTAMRMGIKAQLSIGFGLVLLLLGGITAVALLQFRALSEQMYAIVEVNNVRSTRAAVMYDSVADAYNRLLSAALMEDLEDIKDQIKEHSKMVDEYTKAEAALRQDVGSDPHSEALLKQMDVIKDVAVEGLNVGDSLADMVLDLTRQKTSAAIATNRFKITTEDWLRQIHQLISLNDAENVDAVAKAHATEHTARVVLITAASGALLVGIVAAWLISRSIAHPISIALDFAEAVAKGRLSQAIEPCGTNETTKLLSALDSMQSGLRKLVETVRGTSQNIDIASKEIDAGNQDLARRFETTATQLQRTGSSIKLLSGEVKQSSLSAHEASSLAISAANAASLGGEAFARVVVTMGEIDVSARRIGDISSVIDGIAFQTNILALNAAVEAARAGDQGRGFAVVATEVRNLAKRSADAAREIKLLIGSSLERVRVGMHLVESSGSAMTDMVDSVRRVAKVIEDISDAAERQSEEFDSVTRSMSDLEDVTQHNATLIEQSAAATASLVDQVTYLSNAVRMFQTEQVFPGSPTSK